MGKTSEKTETAIKPFDLAFPHDTLTNDRTLTLRQQQDLALEELHQRVNLSADIATRQVRLQASAADMDQTVRRVQELAQSSRADFKISSTHATASGKTTITVQRNNSQLIAIAALVGLLLLLIFK